MTAPIDINIAQQYLKADGDDNDLIAMQIASATKICEDYCNRRFYVDQAAMDTDFTQALADYTAARTAQTAALLDITDVGTIRMINDKFGSQIALIKGRINGIVLDDAINAAILITLGHIYRNREDNLATGNNVVQVPVGAQRMLQSKLWIGDLADGGMDIHHWCEGS